MGTRTITKLEAGEHVVKVRDWGWAPNTTSHNIDLLLDGHCLAVVGAEQKALMLAMAEKLQYALRAPERRKRGAK